MAVETVLMLQHVIIVLMVNIQTGIILSVVTNA
jgi:hypothetical protein